MALTNFLTMNIFSEKELCTGIRLAVHLIKIFKIFDEIWPENHLSLHKVDHLLIWQSIKVWMDEIRMEATTPDTIAVLRLLERNANDGNWNERNGTERNGTQCKESVGIQIRITIGRNVCRKRANEFPVFLTYMYSEVCTCKSGGLEARRQTPCDAND